MAYDPNSRVHLVLKELQGYGVRGFQGIRLHQALDEASVGLAFGHQR